MGIGVFFLVFGIVFLFGGFVYELTIELILIGIIFSILGIFTIIASQKVKKQAGSLKEKMEMLKLKYEEENLNINQDIMSVGHLVCGIDEENEKVCFFNYVEKVGFEGSVYSFRDILEVELIIDGETITK